MPPEGSGAGLIGRKVGMMRLYDGSGRVRGVTVLEVASNYVTQLRTADRDGYTAVQVGHPGNRKRVTRPQRGHLRQAGLERVALSRLQEFRVEDPAAYTLGEELTADQFEPGSYVNVTATSKGRGFQGGVRRHGFAGGPKSHGQSDRHRAPGSVGAGTTPGRVYKGTKMAGHLGAVTSTVTNLLVVANDPDRRLLFVQGSVPGPNGGLVTIVAGRKPALTGFEPAILPAVADVAEPVEDEEPVVNEDILDVPDTEPGEEPGDQRGSEDVGDVSEAAAEADEQAPPVAEMETPDDASEETAEAEAEPEAAADADQPEDSDEARS